MIFLIILAMLMKNYMRAFYTIYSNLQLTIQSEASHQKNFLIFFLLNHKIKLVDLQVFFIY